MSGNSSIQTIGGYRRATVMTALLTVVVFLYGLLIAEQLLLALLAVAFIVLLYVGWRYFRLPAGSPREPYLKRITAVLAMTIFLYSPLIAEQLLLGLLVSGLLVLIYVAWRVAYGVLRYVRQPSA